MASELFSSVFSELFDNLSIEEFLRREGSFTVRSDDVVVLNFCKSYQLVDRRVQLMIAINLVAMETEWLLFVNATGVSYNDFETEFQFVAEPASGPKTLIRDKLMQTLIWLEETIKTPFPFEMLKF